MTVRQIEITNRVLDMCITNMKILNKKPIIDEEGDRRFKYYMAVSDRLIKEARCDSSKLTS